MADRQQQDECERFWNINKLLRDEGTELLSLGDHRRSTAFMIIMRFCSEKLFRPEEFERFTEQTRNHITSFVGTRDR